MKNKYTAKLFVGHGRLLAVIGLGLVLSACGGGGGGGGGGGDTSGQRADVRTDLSNGSDLGANQAIVLEFSKSMRTNSLDVTKMPGVADNGDVEVEWTKRALSNDTALIRPSTYWEVGAGNAFSASATDTDGNRSQTATLDNLRVIIQFARQGLVFTQLEPVVVGQDDLKATGSGSGPGEFNSPEGSPAIKGTTLYFPDTGNNRLQAFNPVPTTNGVASDFSLTGFSAPHGLAADYSGNLLVSETGDSVVREYTQAPGNGSATSQLIIGSSGSPGCTRTQLDGPQSVSQTPDNGRILVADTNNNRVVVWSAGGTQADVVLGQSGFTSCDANRGGAVGRNTLNRPTGVWSNGNKVVVVDSGNNRVLIWDQFPSSGENPDLVLGQISFTSGGTGGRKATSLRAIQGGRRVTSNGLQLFVSDQGPSSTSTENPKRVLVWNDFPTENDVEATGQIVPAGSQTSKQKYTPDGLLLFNDKLVVGDKGNNRYLILPSL